MVAPNPRKPRVLVDADVLFAGAASPTEHLVTFNIRHFRPGSPEITVLPPGEFVLHMRDLLAHLAVEEGE